MSVEQRNFRKKWLPLFKTPCMLSMNNKIVERASIKCETKQMPAMLNLYWLFTLVCSQRIDLSFFKVSQMWCINDQAEKFPATSLRPEGNKLSPTILKHVTAFHLFWITSLKTYRVLQSFRMIILRWVFQVKNAKN